MPDSRIPSLGNITVRFPPPAPPDLGAALRRDLDRLVTGVGDCSAVNTGLRPEGPPGWCCSIQINRAARTEEWAARVAEFLRGREIPPGAVMEVRRLRGPAVVPLPAEGEDLPGWRRVLFRDGCPASARLTIEIAGEGTDPEALGATLGERVGARGAVTHAYRLSGVATVVLRVADAGDLEALLPEIVAALRSCGAGEGARLSLALASAPRIWPLTAAS